MVNLKHTIAAAMAVSLVGSLAAIQSVNLAPVRADKLAQEISISDIEPAVLAGDGMGDTPEFSAYTPLQTIAVGKDAYILTSGGSINLRAAADTESTILNVLEVGTQVKVIEADEDWYKVEAGEYTGYVKAEYISLDYEKVKEVLLANVMYRKGKITQSVNVRAQGTEDSVILSQAAEGSDVIILEQTQDGWYKIYFGENYDIGYVSAQYCTVGDMVLRKEVNDARNTRLAAVAKNANIKSSGAVEVKVTPEDDAQTITTLSNGAACKIVSAGTNWTKIIITATYEIGYVKTANVEAVQEKKTETASEKSKTTSKTTGKTTQKASSASKTDKTETVAAGNGSKLVAQAAKYIGTKYVYGGSSPSGFDCSGLVQYCCKKLGVSVNRSAASQYSNGVAVSRDNLQPGDLVFFSRGGGISHVVIYAGNGKVIHAPRTGRTVCYESLSTICGYSRYVGARRVM